MTERENARARERESELIKKVNVFKAVIEKVSRNLKDRCNVQMTTLS